MVTTNLKVKLGKLQPVLGGPTKIIGAAVLLLAILLVPFKGNIVDNLRILIDQELILTPSSETFKNWQQTPVPMYIDIYFFNWTNPNLVEKQNVRPAFSQMGPYRFYEKRTKVGFVWNENKTVSFKQTRHWYFDAENSNGSLQDVVTTVNIVPLTAVNMVRYKPFIEKSTTSWGLTAMMYSVHTRRTVEELLFRGYSDKLLTLASNFPFLAKGAKVSDKFGWFYDRNGTDDHDGLFNVDTGEGDLKNLGKILQWNTKNTTGFFSGECSRVAGYSGELFSPGVITRSNKLGLFSPDLCRTIYLEYGGETKVAGLPGIEYRGGLDLIDPGIVDPNNKCYCSGACPPLGLLNLTECRQGAPMFISYPHFYQGNPELRTNVTGMNPNQEDHEFTIAVESTFGFPMQLRGRFQINLMLERDPDIGLYRHIPDVTYMPVMWFDQRAVLSSGLALKMWFVLHQTALVNFILFSLAFLGVSLIFAAHLMERTRIEATKKQQAILVNQASFITVVTELELDPY